MHLNDKPGAAVGRPDQKAYAGNKPLSFLIPVDFSGAAYNALAYALKLAHAIDARIHLFHMTDIHDLPESGNPFVIGNRLHQMEKRARYCLVALMEIIQESGVHVLSADSMIGNIDALLQKKVESLDPDLVLIGKTCYSKASVNRLVASTACPVIAVPGNTPSSPPANIGWHPSGARPGTPALEMLCRITASATGNLSVFSSPRNGNSMPRHLDALMRSRNLRVTYYRLKRDQRAQYIQEFLRSHAIDLLCLSQERRLFTGKRVPDVLYQVDKPVMILPDAKGSSSWSAYFSRVRTQS